MKRTRIGKLLRRLRRNQRGAVALTFIVSSTVMLGGSFGAIDLVRHNVAQGRLQNSLDAATISAGRNLANRTPRASEPEANAWRADAFAFFSSNMPEGYMGSSILPEHLTIDYDEEFVGDYRTAQVISMSVTGELPLISTGFLKVSSFDIAASNQAIRRTRSDLEVVMVVDSSGSMTTKDSGSSKTRIALLQDAANLLVGMVLGAAEANENSRTFIGVVPFTHLVNVGNSETTQRWLTPGWRDSPYVTTKAWSGCITEPRPTNNGPAADVAAVNNGPRYFRPLYVDGQSNVGVDHEPSNDESTIAATFTPTPLGHRQPKDPSLPGSVADGDYEVPTRRNNGDLRIFFRSNPGLCHSNREVSFLSSDATTIDSAISRLSAEGNTSVPAGLLWGWRMLHPEWSGHWGGTSVDLGAEGTTLMPRQPHPDLTKVLILLTDGANTLSGSISTNDKYDYTATYVDKNGRERTISGKKIGSGVSKAINGHSSLNDSGDSDNTTPNRGSSTNALDTFTKTLCTNIKNPNDVHVPGGIKLYTIAFGPGADAALMRDCASNNSYYNSTNVNDLSNVFASIAGDLMELRLIK